MVEVKNLGVPYESEIIYLDDVRLTKLPYETTDDIAETTIRSATLQSHINTILSIKALSLRNIVIIPLIR